MEKQKQKRKIASPSGKLGVLVPGIGAVATTLMAGTFSIRKGLTLPIGSLTQKGTIRRGKRTEMHRPHIKDFVPLADVDDLVFGGWDIHGKDAYEITDTALLAHGAGSAGRFVGARLPERLATTLCSLAGVDPSAPVRALPRERRRGLAALLAGQRLPVVGDRGFTHAEVTAGGIPLAETRLASLQSRVAARTVPLRGDPRRRRPDRRVQLPEGVGQRLRGGKRGSAGLTPAPPGATLAAR